jgi:hypothetical protein
MAGIPFSVAIFTTFSTATLRKSTGSKKAIFPTSLRSIVTPETAAN